MMACNALNVQDNSEDAAGSQRLEKVNDHAKNRCHMCPSSATSAGSKQILGLLLAAAPPLELVTGTCTWGLKLNIEIGCVPYV
jgi:hypothetical protein